MAKVNQVRVCDCRWFKFTSAGEMLPFLFPKVQLSGIKRGAILAGSRRTFHLTLLAETFQVWITNVGYVVESGK